MRDLAARFHRKLYLSDRSRRLRQRLELVLWRARRRPASPPPLFKQRIAGAYAERFSCEIFVETGTFLGDMVFAVRDRFATLYSIELDPWLFQRARARFQEDRHVHIVPGDSYETLSLILPKIDRPALFWLDAHQMVGGVRGVQTTPVAKELEDILQSALPEYVLLIDDARLFTGGDYPALEEVEERIRERHPCWVFEVEHDIIRSHRPLPPGT